MDELLLHERDADGDPNDLEQRLYGAHDRLYSAKSLVKDNGSSHDAQVAYAEAHRLHPESRLRLLFLAASVSQELSALGGPSGAGQGL